MALIVPKSVSTEFEWHKPPPISDLQPPKFYKVLPFSIFPGMQGKNLKTLKRSESTPPWKYVENRNSVHLGVGVRIWRVTWAPVKSVSEFPLLFPLSCTLLNTLHVFIYIYIYRERGGAAIYSVCMYIYIYIYAYAFSQVLGLHFALFKQLYVS